MSIFTGAQSGNPTLASNSLWPIAWVSPYLGQNDFGSWRIAALQTPVESHHVRDMIQASLNHGRWECVLLYSPLQSEFCSH